MRILPPCSCRRSPPAVWPPSPRTSPPPSSQRWTRPPGGIISQRLRKVLAEPDSKKLVKKTVVPWVSTWWLQLALVMSTINLNFLAAWSTYWRLNSFNFAWTIFDNQVLLWEVNLQGSLLFPKIEFFYKGWYERLEFFISWLSVVFIKGR